MVHKKRMVSIGFIIVILGISLLFLITATVALDPKAAAVPILISLLMVGLCSLLLVVEWKAMVSAKQEPPDSGEVKNHPAATRPWWFMLIFSVVYYFLIESIGFFTSTIIFMMLVPYLLRYKNWKAIVASCLIFFIVYWIGFDKLMQIQFPHGLLFR